VFVVAGGPGSAGEPEIWAAVMVNIPLELDSKIGFSPIPKE
jgi:hypothetical protein